MENVIKVVFCMVFSRNAAMAFNRYIDRDIVYEREKRTPNMLTHQTDTLHLSIVSVSLL